MRRIGACLRSIGTAPSLALAIGTVPIGLAAQEVGDRVRVALPDAVVVGEVVALDPSGLELSLADGGGLSANRNDVFRIERSWQRRSVWVGSALVGFAVGCHLGVCLDEHGWGNAHDWKIAGAGAVAGFGVAALGGIEIWDRIALPDRPEGPIVGDRVRAALTDRTIEGNVTRIDRRSFVVAAGDGSMQSVDRSGVLRLEELTVERRWLEGLVLGLVLSGVYVTGKAIGQWSSAVGCAFTLGYARTQCDKLGLGREELLLVGALPIVGLIAGATQRAEEWQVVQPRSSDGGLTPVIDLGIDAYGQPMAFLGARIRH